MEISHSRLSARLGVASFDYVEFARAFLDYLAQMGQTLLLLGQKFANLL
jgi:hypothetical protein